jgi:hypothetical protein
MKAVLFCNQPYSFSIMRPIEKELKKRGCETLWFLTNNLKDIFPFEESNYTLKISDLINFKPDVIFVPGQDVPYYLRGLKVQIFHGLASEKKGHFRIRDYFDLYLTQGPHFTDGFRELSKNRDDIDVIETGWSKLDYLFTHDDSILEKKNNLLKKYKAEKIVLYAPTFSPRLTSAEDLFSIISAIADEDNILLICKFHDLMSKEIIDRYKNNKAIIVSRDVDSTPLLQVSDIMVSDTSSIVYEFIFLDKPVVTLNSQSENIVWSDVNNADDLLLEVRKILNGVDNHLEDRKTLIDKYHPYIDGESSKRMIDAVEEYLLNNKVPEKRKVPWHRKIKMIRKYGYN